MARTLYSRLQLALSWAMINSDDLSFFVALAEEASLTAAARKMNVTSSAVTQRLKNLEERLRLRLLHRNGRSILLTDEGELLLTRGRHIVSEMAVLEEKLLGSRGSLTGALRIVAPFGFGRRYISTICGDFQRAHPGVAVDLHLSDRMGRFPDRRWDLAVHIGELPTSSMRVSTLARNRRVLCASPSYLAEHISPSSPNDLADHQCLMLRENDEDAGLWRFSSSSGTASVRVTPTLSTNDGDILRQWALDGHGVIIRSEWDVNADLNAGRLVRLLPNYALPDADVVLLVDSSSERRLRTKAFVKHLRAAFSPPPW